MTYIQVSVQYVHNSATQIYNAKKPEGICEDVVEMFYRGMVRNMAMKQGAIRCGGKDERGGRKEEVEEQKSRQPLIQSEPGWF